MIVVSFETEMREAFAAGQAAAMASLGRCKGIPAEYAQFFELTPKTYEEWIASIADRPAVARG